MNELQLMNSGVPESANSLRVSAGDLAASVNAKLGFAAVHVLGLAESGGVGQRPAGELAVLPKAWAAAHETTERLVSIEVARAHFGLSRASFWRFRKRHRIRVLPGRRVDIADIVEAYEAERRGKRRLAA